ncbi:hypothetical protein [Rhodococcus jostii]|uniref:hypothetical protein n=1 Tax=Rhodococcus jostii TaxID=132919 RepID=UPI00364F9D47
MPFDIGGKKSSARIDGTVLEVYLHLVASPHPRQCHPFTRDLVHGLWMTPHSWKGA